MKALPGLSVELTKDIATKWLQRHPGLSGIPVEVDKTPEDFGYRLANENQAASFINGGVHIYADRINRPVTVVAILRHELLGHLLFDQMQADEREWLYLQTAEAIESDSMLRSTYEDLVERGYSPKPDRRLCEEIFASHAEFNIKLSPLQKTLGRIKAACRTVLNKAGVTLPMSAGDVRYYIDRFHKGLIDGSLTINQERSEALSVSGSDALKRFQAHLEKWQDKQSEVESGFSPSLE